MKQISRRHFLLMGVGCMAAGCAESTQLMTTRPRPSWPQTPPAPKVNGQAITLPPPQPVPASASFSQARFQTIPRKTWARSRPIPSRLQAIGSIKRITIHHEGGTPVWFSDTSSTAKRLESIRKSHLKRLRAGDIGYHYVIDRAGRVWQGRDMRYQGAHVRDHNKNNLGVMVLGNFDLQRPTDVQIASLRQALAVFVKQYHVSASQVFTHQELNITSCPGKALQGRVSAIRRGGLLL